MKVIKIGAVWCPGCHVMRPRWAEIEQDYPFLVTEYFDFDEHEDMLTSKYKINDILPVAIFIDNDGNELERIIGIVTKKEIISVIDDYYEK